MDANERLNLLRQKLGFVIGALCTSFVLLMLATSWLNDLQQVPIYLSFSVVLIIIFMPHPWTELSTQDHSPFKRLAALTLDLLLIVAAIAGGLYISLNYGEMIWRVGAESGTDIFFGVITLISLLEATRRTVGMPIVLIALLMFAYTLYGNYLPEIVSFFGVGYKRAIAETYCGASGIYGIPLKVMFRYVFIFLFFGNLLDVTGGSKHFMDMARAIAGRFTGGLAKVAIVSSALMGSINGSANANVAVTGAFTIPAMKKHGYDPEVAAAIESIASTGGQILPPVMGAVAFVMADYVGVPYLQICKVALIPAIFYYFSILTVIHFYAKRKLLQGEPSENLPHFFYVFKQGYFLLLSIIVIVGALVLHYSPVYAALLAILTVIVFSSLRKISRLNWERVKRLFQQTASNGAMIGCAAATAGVIVGFFGVTGLTARMSHIIMAIAGDSTFLLLVLSMVASIIVGMTATTTVTYILLAVIIAPALVAKGIPVVIAHLFLLYFGCFSMITPPVGLATYTACGIAGTRVNKTGLIGLQMSLPIFIFPFLFVYHPELSLVGNFSIAQLMVSLLAVTIISITIASLFERYLLDSNNFWDQALLAIACILQFVFHLLFVIAGIFLVGLVAFLQNKRRKANTSGSPNNND